MANLDAFFDITTALAAVVVGLAALLIPWIAIRTFRPQNAFCW